MREPAHGIPGGETGASLDPLPEDDMRVDSGPGVDLEDDALWERALARAVDDDEPHRPSSDRAADTSVIAFLERQGAAPAPFALRDAADDDEGSVVTAGDVRDAVATERYDVVGEIARGGFGLV
jgi:hypothetical protein